MVIYSAFLFPRFIIRQMCFFSPHMTTEDWFVVSVMHEEMHYQKLRPWRPYACYCIKIGQAWCKRKWNVAELFTCQSIKTCYLYKVQLHFSRQLYGYVNPFQLQGNIEILKWRCIKSSRRLRQSVSLVFVTQRFCSPASTSQDFVFLCMVKTDSISFLGRKSAK